MKVKATIESKKNNIEIGNLGIVEPGTEFEVTEERYNILHGNNVYGLVFVEKVEEEPVEEPKEVLEVKAEKPKKVVKKKPSKKD